MWLTKGVPQQGQRQVTTEAIAIEQQLEHKAPPWNTNGFAQPFQRPFMVFLINHFNIQRTEWFILTNSLILFILLAMIITRTKWSWNMIVTNRKQPAMDENEPSVGQFRTDASDLLPDRFIYNHVPITQVRPSPPRHPQHQTDFHLRVRFSANGAMSVSTTFWSFFGIHVS